MWTGRRILREIADVDRRRRVLACFWKHGDAQTKATAIIQLARALHFRDETLRKLPLEKKAELLAGRIGAPEYEQIAEMALMQYHTNEATKMMSAFLDEWKIPHENGSIEEDVNKAPSAAAVRKAITAIGDQYDRADILMYLATAGLLMGEKWQKATWPVVDEMVATSDQ